MSLHVAEQQAGAKPRPEGAIAARKRESTAKLASVSKAVNRLARIGVPITPTAVYQLAGVSRSFTYENAEARKIILAAQVRSQAHAKARIDTLTAQQEASWRERALNAEDQVGELRREVAAQRQLISDLAGQLREPDGVWVANDRDRLRRNNEALLTERNELVRERNELRRRLDGARANISRINELRVTELFPEGPGKTRL